MFEVPLWRREYGGVCFGCSVSPDGTARSKVVSDEPGNLHCDARRDDATIGLGDCLRPTNVPNKVLRGDLISPGSRSSSLIVSSSAERVSDHWPNG